MKTLSIQQPWGSIICAGLKHVENRSWGLKDLPLRILIHVGAKKVSGNNRDECLPEQWQSLMINARAMGYLPYTEELPYSSIIGWADVVRCDEPGNNTSDIWAQNELTGWVLDNVHVFDEPIPNVKGKLGLFDYPIDEDNLPPSHPAVFKEPEINGDSVTMPLSNKDWNDIMNGKIKAVGYVLTDDNYDMFGDENGDLKPFNQITFTNNGNTATYKLTEDTNIYTFTDEEGKPYLFTGLNGGNYQWLFAQFVLGERIS